MAIFGCNICCRISYQLQTRIFSIPWLKENRAVLCFKARACSSSVPVRYIPKTQASPPAIASEETVVHQCSGSNSSRSGVLNAGNDVWREFTSDEKYWNQNGSENKIPINDLIFDDSELDGGVVDCEFMEEDDKIIEEFGSLKEEDHQKQNVSGAGKTRQDAEKLGIELLATRAYTAVELRKKLHGRKFPLDIIEIIINDFQSRGLINDCLYAEAFSQSRWSLLSWGPRRIKQALLKKGVSEVDVEKALTFVFKDSEPGDDLESGLGLSKLSMDHLFVQASKQWLRGLDVPHETRKSRIIRWLQYRGFNWGVVSFILKKLESQYPP